MSRYLRKLKAPVSVFQNILHGIAEEHNDAVAIYRKIQDEPFGIARFISRTPYIAKVADITVERNATATTITNAIKAVVYATDLDLHGVLTIDLSAVDSTTADVYSATATITDRFGATDSVTIAVTVADTLAPVIVAADETVAFGDIAAWDNDVEATDNGSDDITSDVVITYFQADGTTPIASLANFRTYLANSGAGGVHGHVHYNVEDAAGHAATEVIVTITAEYKPVITVASTTVSLLYADVDTWEDADNMSATGVAHEDATASVVITYFQANGSTAIADLAAFRTYIKNGNAGGLAGVVKYNLTGATQVSITVTSATQD